MEMLLKPGDIVRIRLVNDSTYDEAEVLSVDDFWIEIANKHTSGLYEVDTIPRARIAVINKIRNKRCWVPQITSKKVYMELHLVNEDELALSQDKGCIIFTSFEDARNYLESIAEQNELNGIHQEYRIEDSNGHTVDGWRNV